MAKKTHWMVDLETLGVRPDAAIIEIGAVSFDPYGDGVDKRFCVGVDVTRQGGSVDSGTLDFWLRQPDASRLHLADLEKLSLGDALDAMHAAFSPWGAVTGVWSHGPAFDVTILQSAYNRARKAVPWSYKAIRDTRTLAEAINIVGGSMPAYPKVGTGHSGVDDAESQALWVQAMYRELGRFKAVPDPLA